jgi:hypothetical protein
MVCFNFFDVYLAEAWISFFILSSNKPASNIDAAGFTCEIKILRTG